MKKENEKSSIIKGVILKYEKYISLNSRRMK